MPGIDDGEAAGDSRSATTKVATHLGVTGVELVFDRKLVDEYGELDEDAVDCYLDELVSLFAESPEGAGLQARGIRPGRYLGMFLDYELRYVGAAPAEMEAGDIAETLDVFAEKVTGRPEDLEEVIPELEAFCDFAQRPFEATQAASWKREIERQAASFRRSLRDPGHWGMAKSMMMEGLARGFDLNTEQGINQWMQIFQAEQLARVELSAGLGLDGPFLAEPFELGAIPGSRRAKAKEKTKRRMRKASRRRNRR